MTSRGRPPKRSKKRDELFFKAIASGVSQRIACEISGYNERTVIRYKKDSPDFKKMFDEADAVNFSVLEDRLKKIATEGIVEIKVKRDGKGKVKEETVIKKDSLQALIFLMKAKESGRYNYDKSKADVEEPQNPAEFAEDISDQDASFIYQQMMKGE
ncbi:conserved hypothetical protein [Vibrio chagasii]|nr:conserved hypothetical protein [Vibrio chagasii]